MKKGAVMNAADVKTMILLLFTPEESRDRSLACPPEPANAAKTGSRGISGKAVFWMVMGIVFSILISQLD